MKINVENANVAILGILKLSRPASQKTAQLIKMQPVLVLFLVVQLQIIYKQMVRILTVVMLKLSETASQEAAQLWTAVCLQKWPL